ADMRDVPEEKREAELARRLKNEIATPFDLRRSPLLRARLMKLDEEEHVLALIMHHIASDGWSLGVLARELDVLYEAYSQGTASPLAELPIQYADYAVWQRKWLQGEVEQTQLRYWQKQLAGIPPALDLPIARTRPVVPDYQGAYHTFHLSKE